jgi:hypothetical protein
LDESESEEIVDDGDGRLKMEEAEYRLKVAIPAMVGWLVVTCLERKKRTENEECLESGKRGSRKISLPQNLEGRGSKRSPRLDKEGFHGLGRIYNLVRPPFQAPQTQIITAHSQFVTI